MPEPPDGDRLERFVHGDRDAFESLFHEHRHEVYRWALRIVRDRSTADDDAARDLWPAVIGRIDQRTRWSALDLGLAAAATAALLVFPEWLFLLLYHL